jgi:hypothetical protein
MASKKTPARKPKTLDTPLAARASSPRQFTTWTPALVKAAIRQAEAGSLGNAAACCAWLLTDDRVAGCLEARVDQMLGLPVQFQPGDKAAPEAMIDDLADDFSDGWTEEELSNVLTWGLLLGYCTTRHQPIVGASGRILPNLSCWNPAGVNYDIVRGGWTAQEEGNPTPVDVTPDDGDWGLYTPYGKDRPWSKGLWQSLGLLVVAKQYAIQDWNRSSEKATMLVFESNLIDRDGYPVETSKAQRQALVDAIADRGGDTTLALPAGWELKLLQVADNYHIYLDQINMLNTAIAVRIRGGNLSTQVEGGSLAAAESQAQTGDEAKVRKDSSTLGTFLRKQSIDWWSWWNFGTTACPWPKWEKKAAKVIDPNTASALSTLSTAGFELDVDLLRDEYGLDYVTGYKKPPPPPSPFGAPGKGDPDPADPEDPTAHKHPHVTASAAGQRYLDRTVERVIASTPVAAPTADLLAAVNAARNEDDLRQRLLETYAEMDRQALEGIFEKAFILAELSGRYSVLYP